MVFRDKSRLCLTRVCIQLKLSKAIGFEVRVKNYKDVLNMFGLDKSPILGLDIGSTGIKFLSLTKEGDKIKVLDYAIQSFEPGIVVERNIVNREKAVQAMRDAKAKMDIDTNKVSLCIGSAMSITRLIQLDSGLSDKEIGEEISMSSDRYIPYPLHEVNMDYKVIGKSLQGEDLVDIVIVATKKEIIEKLSDIILEANLAPEVINLDSYALASAFEIVAHKLPAEGKDKTIALVDIGATSTNFVVVRNGNVLYMRDQAFGSQQLIDEVQNNYGLDYDEAILAVRYEDLPKDYDTEILDPFKKAVAQQINRFCQFFYSASEYKNVDYIFITGGCTSIMGIDVEVQQKMHVKTFIADPFAEMILASHINEQEFNFDKARLMSCCGLALRNIE